MCVSVKNLTVVHRAPGGGSLPALGPLSLEITSGEFVSLVGPSGCGKSTLIRVLAGLQAPTQGSASLDGQIVEQPSSRVGLMFQDANLMPWRTVLDNIALPLELTHVDQPTRYAAARDLLDRLGLMEFERAYPGNLSGGMAQRVALGRVLVNRPELLLLDEPFGALDALTREQVSLDLLNLWRQSEQTVLMVTHDIQEAVLLADRVLVMSRRPGQISADIRVPLERPRQLEDVFTPQFTAIARQVRAAINQG
ncbi:MAG: ABC transporter ATP-binding protein [Anaerolineae bacterium]|nr:ABC transporter ATP-binding protein [Anaerolineae bacterium]